MIVKMIFYFRNLDYSLFFSVIFCSVQLGFFFFSFALFSGHCHKHRFSMLQNQSPPLLSQLGGTGMDECALPLLGFSVRSQKISCFFPCLFSFPFHGCPLPLGAMCNRPRVVFSKQKKQKKLAQTGVVYTLLSQIHTLIVMHIYTFYSPPFGYKYTIAHSQLFSLSFQLSFSWMPSPFTFQIFQAAFFLV